jgi:hypothetical protein
MSNTDVHGGGQISERVRQLCLGDENSLFSELWLVMRSEEASVRLTILRTGSCGVGTLIFRVSYNNSNCH